MRRSIITVLVACAVLSSAACGRGGDGSTDGPPVQVPGDLAPAALGNGAYVTRPDDQAKATFTKLDKRALVDDGRLWQIRQVGDDRLIGTLQITTVKAKVDLAEEEQRLSILNHILPGGKQELDVGGMTVWASETNDKLVYVWFGREVYEVLQLKGSRIDPEAILEEIIGHQVAAASWKGLPR